MGAVARVVRALGVPAERPLVDPCASRTLVEVVIAVRGLPAPLDLLEARTLETAARRAFPRLEIERGLLAPESAGVLPPVAFLTARRDRAGWAARWGHRVVELTFAPGAGDGSPFDASMEDVLERWLAVAEEAYAFAGVPMTIATVAFGHAHRIWIEDEQPDLSRWFRFNCAIEAAGAETGLSRISAGALVRRPDRGGRVRLELVAEAVDGVVVAVVETVAEQDAPDGTTIASASEIARRLEDARSLAQETFLSVLTEHTLAWIQVGDDAASSA